MNATGKFLLGITLGGALGAVIGMLLAPRSGAETRQMLKSEMNTKVTETRGQIKKSYDDSLVVVKDKINEKMTVMKDKANQLGESARQWGERLETAGRQVVNKNSGANAEPADAAAQTPADMPPQVENPV
jgi:gas vesicle protein